MLFGLRPHDFRRLSLAFALLFVILIGGTGGYHFLTGANLLDALYMTVITVTTVGYGEVVPMNDTTQLFTTLLIVASVSWGAWAIQSALATILSSEFRQAVQQLRSIRGIRKMENHTIICGFGRIGRAVAAELARNGEEFVIIEDSEDLVDSLREQGYHTVRGDATSDEALISAGVHQAKRVMAVLNSDNANIVTVLSARQLNTSLWIGSRVVSADAASKLRRAGADEVVSPYDFGGRRMALTALRPRVSEFLSEVVFDEGRGAEMDELLVDARSELAEKTLGEINLRKRFGITVISLYHPRSDGHNHEAGFELNPGPDTVLHAGDALIVVGKSGQLIQVHDMLKA